MEMKWARLVVVAIGEAKRAIVGERRAVNNLDDLD
jgi:hypothetical protein